MLTAETLVEHKQEIFVEEVSKENICRNNSEKCLFCPLTLDQIQRWVQDMLTRV